MQIVERINKEGLLIRPVVDEFKQILEKWVVHKCG